jgi:hypothetical protein
MLLIWGWRSLLKVLGVGEFHCPNCGVDRAYSLVRPRRWFTFFFVPVIPLSWGETYVECQSCKAAYRETVLTMPTSRQFSYMLALAARALYAKIVSASYLHDESKIERAAVGLAPFVGAGYNEANVIADVEGFRGHALGEYLAPFAEQATTEAKEAVLGSAAWYAYSDGDCPPEVSEVLTEAGMILGLSAAHTSGIIGTAAA